MTFKVGQYICYGKDQDRYAKIVKIEKYSGGRLLFLSENTYIYDDYVITVLDIDEMQFRLLIS